MKNPLKSAFIAKENMRRKPFRSFTIIIVLAFFTLSCIVGSVITESLSKGLQSASNRLGADIMVVPEGFDPHIESILLSATPSTYFLPKGAEEKIKAIEGVEVVTAQSYLATLSASCCSYPLQLIGIDNATDFLIKPWLFSAQSTELKDGDIIVGAKVENDVGEQIAFFGKNYKISGKLQQTGLDLDASVFMTQSTLAEMAKDAVRILKHPLSEDGSLVSTLLVKVKPGFSSTQVAKTINKAYNSDGIYALFSKKLVNELNGNLDFIAKLVFISIGFVWVLSVVIVLLLVTLSFFERKKELAVLSVLGATKRKIIGICLLEVFYQGLYGAVLGGFFSAIALLIMQPVLVQQLKMPFLMPSIWKMLVTFGVSVALTLLTTMVAALVSILVQTKKEVYLNLKGNE